ncbi:MAG: MmcQ/YjbR family DNA-binding protein [Ignavibacteriaceae bacterium]|jgi:predicted DNA-binding protein (MmcQ/YjbR family)
MITIEEFRKLALSFQDATEEPHFDKASFRVNKKIFATFDEINNQAVVKLSPLDQSVFCSFDKAVMYPVSGTWGRQGWTVIELDKVKKEMLKDALKTAYHNLSAKKK